MMRLPDDRQTGRQTNAPLRIMKCDWTMTSNAWNVSLKDETFQSLSLERYWRPLQYSYFFIFLVVVAVYLVLSFTLLWISYYSCITFLSSVEITRGTGSSDGFSHAHPCAVNAACIAAITTRGSISNLIRFLVYRCNHQSCANAWITKDTSSYVKRSEKKMCHGCLEKLSARLLSDSWRQSQSSYQLEGRRYCQGIHRRCYGYAAIKRNAWCHPWWRGFRWSLFITGNGEI